MTKDTFIIEKVVPADIDSLVKLHRSVFAGTIGVRLGKLYSRAFITWFVKSPNTTVLVARQNHSIVGYVFGAPTGYTTDINRELFYTIIFAILSHPWVLFDKRLLLQIPERFNSLRKTFSQSTLHVISEPVSRIYRLTGIGVSEKFRKMGVGKKLITAYEHQIWELGFEEIQLSVYSANKDAIFLYNNAGWLPVSDNNEIVTFSKKRS